MLYVMLVGAYPFERPEDKQDNQKLQKMIQVRVQTRLVGTTTLVSSLAPVTCLMHVAASAADL